MLTLNLDEREQIILRNLLESCIADIRMEIIQTDNIGYKEMLQRRKQVIKRILQELITNLPETPIAE